MDNLIATDMAKHKALQDYIVTWGSNRTWQLDPIDQPAHDKKISQLKSARIYATTTKLRIVVAGQLYTIIAALRKIKADRFRVTTRMGLIIWPQGRKLQRR